MTSRRVLPPAHLPELPVLWGEVLPRRSPRQRDGRLPQRDFLRGTELTERGVEGCDHASPFSFISAAIYQVPLTPSWWHLFTLLAFFFFPLALLLQLYRFSSTNYMARCSSACGAEPCRTNSSVSMQQCALECCNTPLCLQLNASSYGNCPRGSPGLGVRG